MKFSKKLLHYKISNREALPIAPRVPLSSVGGMTATLAMFATGSPARVSSIITARC